MLPFLQTGNCVVTMGPSDSVWFPSSIPPPTSLWPPRSSTLMKSFVLFWKIRLKMLKSAARLISNSLLITEDHLKLALSAPQLFSLTPLHHSLALPRGLPSVGWVTVPAGKCFWVWLRNHGCVLGVTTWTRCWPPPQHPTCSFISSTRPLCLDSASGASEPSCFSPSHPVTHISQNTLCVAVVESKYIPVQNYM